MLKYTPMEMERLLDKEGARREAARAAAQALRDLAVRVELGEVTGRITVRVDA
jgi:hypothetical protein